MSVVMKEELSCRRPGCMVLSVLVDEKVVWQREAEFVVLDIVRDDARSIQAKERKKLGH